MCGRYAASRRPEDMVEEFELVGAEVGEDDDEPLPARYNVAPTDPVYAVLERPPRQDKEAPPQRRLHTVRWGLVPSWAKDPSIGSRMINARVETVADKPAFKRAFAKRRCLLPADGYYEWYAREGAPKNAKKQPFFIRPSDGGVLAMAGLYELWRDQSKADDDPDRWLWTCTVITTSATDDLGRIHDRMPMLVERERYADWLAAEADDPDRLRGLLVPAAPGRLTAYPVSTEVSNVRNDGPHLVQPIGAEGEDVEEERSAASGQAEEETLF